MFQPGLHIATFDWELRGIVAGKPVLLLEPVLVPGRAGRVRGQVGEHGVFDETEYWKMLTPTGEVVTLELRLVDATMVI